MPNILYLASASPRRREILTALGFETLLLPASIDETVQSGETVEHYVTRMARWKNQAACQANTGTEWPVLSADTVVALDGQILGKPRHAEHARELLTRLSGREHQVWTAVCASYRGQILEAVQCSGVRFKTLNEQEIEDYIRSGEPMDKAGAYGIQGVGGVFVTHLTGSFSGVMGLPVFETMELLRRLHVPVPPFAQSIPAR